MKTTENRVYAGIDVTKYFFAIVIVAIHFTAFSDIKIYDTTLFKILNLYVFDFAVPFFFTTSGYLLCKKINSTKQYDQTLKNYFNRLLIPYIFWGAWYFLIGILSQTISGSSFQIVVVEKLKLLVFSSPGGGLWYVQSVLILVMILRLIRIDRFKFRFVCLLVLLALLACVSDSIFELSETVDWARNFCDQYNKIFVTRLNFAFYGVYFLLGFIVYRIQGKISYERVMMLAIITYAL